MVDRRVFDIESELESRRAQLVAAIKATPLYECAELYRLLADVMEEQNNPAEAHLQRQTADLIERSPRRMAYRFAEIAKRVGFRAAATITFSRGKWNAMGITGMADRSQAGGSFTALPRIPQYS